MTANTAVLPLSQLAVYHHFILLSYNIHISSILLLYLHYLSSSLLLYLYLSSVVLLYLHLTSVVLLYILSLFSSLSLLLSCHFLVILPHPIAPSLMSLP